MCIRDRLSEDLSRRDFTVNAMAFHPERGLVDCFGGKEDLKNRILKCVGEPERRFREDALRILRCLRFSSALEFAIEEDTRQALLKHRELLKKIAPERLQAEFSKLILGEDVYKRQLFYRAGVSGRSRPEAGAASANAAGG